MNFAQLVKAHTPPPLLPRLPVKVLSLDPGETTGYAIWHRTEWFPDRPGGGVGGNLTLSQAEEDPGLKTETPLPLLFDCGQLNTKIVRNAVESFEDLFKVHTFDIVVMEDYRVYGWKTEDHAWNSLLTPRVIGCIETLCTQKKIPYVKQSAQVAKQFCTDDKLENWGFWQKGMRHARDAIRHGAYYYMFGYSKRYDSEGFVLK